MEKREIYCKMSSSLKLTQGSEIKLIVIDKLQRSACSFSSGYIIMIEAK